MTRRRGGFSIFRTAVCLFLCCAGADGGDFREFYSRLAEEARSGRKAVVSGGDGWLFMRAELNFLSAGEFWGEKAAGVSKAAKPEWADPLPAILDFNRQLAAVGARLVVVPIPAKSALYPEFLPGGGEAGGDGRPDRGLAEFFGVLEKEGVAFVDLLPAFMEEKRADPSQPLYCRTDNHWTPWGARLAAREVAGALSGLGLAGEARECPPGGASRLGISGGLSQMTGGRKGEISETITVFDVPGGKGVSAASPVMLLGDSFGLVYHSGGDLFAEGRGLPDFLSCLLGGPVDLLGVRGSGSTPARLSLRQRIQANPAALAGKKAVIWYFASSELTESQGWRLVDMGL